MNKLFVIPALKAVVELAVFPDWTPSTNNLNSPLDLDIAT